MGFIISFLTGIIEFLVKKFGLSHVIMGVKIAAYSLLFAAYAAFLYGLIDLLMMVRDMFVSINDQYVGLQSSSDNMISLAFKILDSLGVLKAINDSLALVSPFIFGSFSLLAGKLLFKARDRVIQAINDMEKYII